jgi:hypothetical protein
LLRRRDDSKYARDVHYACVVACSQQWQKCARHAHDAPEVDLKQPFEVFVRDLLERASHCDTRVVDEHIDAVMFRCDNIGKLSHCDSVGDVDTMSRYAQAVLLDHLSRASQAGFVNVCECEMTATVCE